MTAPISNSFTPVRFYTQFDPYFFSVDNRPLIDLAANDLVLASAIDGLVTNVLSLLAVVPADPTILTINSATPSVAGFGRFTTANTLSTTITNFTGGIGGQQIVILCNDSHTVIQSNGTSISSSSGSNITLITGTLYTLYRMGSLWRING